MVASTHIPDSDELLAGLSRTCEPLDDARTLPRAVYTSAAIRELEDRALFGRSWLAIGREADLPRAGSFVTREFAGERVLVVRAEDGVLRAFFNVCRHRGVRLVDEERGELRGVIACPYHAWTYGLDGGFLRAPKSSDLPRCDDRDLVPLVVAVREGFVFANLNPDAAPLVAHFADLPDLARFRLAELQSVKQLAYEIAADWKIVCENYSECYHCPLVHPQLSRLSDLESGGFADGVCYNGGPMRLRDGVETLSTTGRSRSPALTPVAGERLVHYYLVYPNLMLGIHPDYVVTHQVWPLATGRARIECEWLFPGEALADPRFDATEVVRFWDVTNRQDWALCERVQRGTGSRGYRPGPYHPSERCVHAFDRWYARWLSDVLAPQPSGGTQFA